MVAQVAQAPPATTIVPFADIAKLPACATLCGPLFDANGACVPPAVPTGQPAGYLDCFCGDPRVSAFSSGTAGVCDTVCTAGGLESIANWFQGACSVKNAGGNKGSGGSNTAAGGQSGNTGGGGSVGAPTDGGGDWLSNHWKWVIMLVVLVVGIAGIWVGACVWRRRHLRKKDRQVTLGQKHSGSASHPSWGPAVQGADSFNMSGNVRDSTRSNGPLMNNQYGPPVSAFEEEKPGRTSKVKKWISTDRS